MKDKEMKDKKKTKRTYYTPKKRHVAYGLGGLALAGSIASVIEQRKLKIRQDKINYIDRTLKHLYDDEQKIVILSKFLKDDDEQIRNYVALIIMKLEQKPIQQIRLPDTIEEFDKQFTTFKNYGEALDFIKLNITQNKKLRYAKMKLMETYETVKFLCEYDLIKSQQNSDQIIEFLENYRRKSTNVNLKRFIVKQIEDWQYAKSFDNLIQEFPPHSEERVSNKMNVNDNTDWVTGNDWMDGDEYYDVDEL